MLSAGIDIGSRTIKFVVMDEGRIKEWKVADATSRPAAVASSMLENHKGIYTIATGYGRNLLDDRICKTITEIKACATGIHHLFGESGIIIDIGGQDLKVISIDTDGGIVKFEMNDRCAAGTGRFLEIMAERLDYDIDDFGTAALKGTDDITVNSLCTVFAESEVVGLINRNESRENIARALHKSAVGKIAAMFRRIESADENVFLVGGGALNPAVRFFLEKELGIRAVIPENPQIIAALGAAVIASRVADSR